MGHKMTKTEEREAAAYDRRRLAALRTARRAVYQAVDALRAVGDWSAADLIEAGWYGEGEADLAVMERGLSGKDANERRRFAGALVALEATPVSAMQGAA